MRHYNVRVADTIWPFVALDDGYAVEAVIDILQRKAFRTLHDQEAFRIDGPDGPLDRGFGTLGEIRTIHL